MDIQSLKEDMVILQQNINIKTVENASLKQDMRLIQDELRSVKIFAQELRDENLNLRSQLSAKKKKEAEERQRIRTLVMNIYQAFDPLLQALNDSQDAIDKDDKY